MSSLGSLLGRNLDGYHVICSGMHFVLFLHLSGVRKAFKGGAWRFSGGA